MLENKFICQQMVPADLAEVVAIERLCYQQPWQPEQFLQELDNPLSQVVLLRVDGQLCGYICYWLVVDELQILNVATAPEWQRQGVADRLLRQAIENCQGPGLATAWLEVRVGNLPAIRLYQRHGFIVSGTRRGYYHDGEDALLMLRDFSS